MTEAITFSTTAEVDTETRTVKGIAVPYNVPTYKTAFPQEFSKGSLVNLAMVQIYYQHDSTATPIGRVTSFEDTDDGLLFTAKIASTPKGDEVYTLLKEGVLDAFSIGVFPLESFEREDGVTVHTKAELYEVSVVNDPAFDAARVMEVHNAQASVVRTEINKEDESEEKADSLHMEIEKEIGEIRSELEVFARDLSQIKEGENEQKPVLRFQSGAQFLKALAANDESAKKELTFAYTGAVIADSHTSNDWKSDTLKVVDLGRPLVTLFDRGPLGSTGNSVEYPKWASTGDADVQAAEGDNLAYFEGAVTTATTPIKTVGVYSELSRQAIERSDVAYLEAVLRGQAASYGKKTNALVRAAVVAATPQTGTSFTLSSATSANFLGAAVDGVQKINDNSNSGLQADVILVSTDVYAKLATLVDSAGRPMFSINGDSSNSIGSINVPRIAGSLAGLPVVLDAGLAAKTFYVASSHAVMTWENAGAPLPLQDENIINLTKTFSLYGYLAVGVKDANGLVKATVA